MLPMKPPPVADDDGHKLNGDDSFNCECGGNENDEVDSVGDEDIMHSEPEEDEDGSDMEDEYDGKDMEKMQRHIASFLCFEEVTPHLVKRQAFRNLINEFCPSLTLGHDTTEKHCLTIFEEAKSEVKRTLNNMGRLIPLSVDMLTDYHHSGILSHYICLVANFVDDNWELKKWILCFQRHEVGETDFIDEVVAKTLDDYRLMDKVHSFTSRNVDTIDETLESIESQLKEKNRLPSDSRLFHVSCCAEMFGLMAKDAFDEISRIISKLEYLCWSRSKSMWHLTNSKLKNALEMQSEGEFNSVSERYYSVPSDDEWAKVRIVNRLVESAYVVAKQVFEVRHPTANKFLHNLQDLRADLLIEASSSDCFTCSVSKKMLQRLDKYIRKNYLVLAIALVMDPRCKMQYLEYIYTKFEDIDGVFQSGAVLEAIRSFYSDYSSSGIEREISEGTSNVKNLPGGEEYVQFVQAKDLPKKSDLDIYLEEPVLPWDENFNVLKWWKSEGPKYPNVSKMARDILAVPMSVATSDDAYYYMENRHADIDIITSGAQMMNVMMCCRSWKPWKSFSSIDYKMRFLAAGVNLLNLRCHGIAIAHGNYLDPFAFRSILFCLSVIARLSY